MATTHGFVGAAVALPVLSWLAPEFLLVGTAAAFIGGMLPDVDLFYRHRQLLHYPYLGWIAVAVAVPVAAWWPAPETVAAACAAAAAALHSFMDQFGGGRETRPWRRQSDRSVYSHLHGQWLQPRRWIRYDGSPEDFLFQAAVAVPVLLTAPQPLQRPGLLILLVSLGYTVLRKQMWLLPDPLLAYFEADERNG